MSPPDRDKGVIEYIALEGIWCESNSRVSDTIAFEVSSETRHKRRSTSSQDSL